MGAFNKNKHISDRGECVLTTFGQFRKIANVERIKRGLEHGQLCGALVAMTAVVLS